MGWKSGAATGAAVGFLGGPLGAAIGGAVGGFLGAISDDDGDDVSIHLTKQGLSFPIADVSVRWAEVEAVEFDRDDGNDAFTLVGGRS